MQEMTPQAAFDAWQAGDVAIVDVREQDEYDTTRVDGMPLIPMSEFGGRAGEFPGELPLVIMCRSGRRSGRPSTMQNAVPAYEKYCPPLAEIVAPVMKPASSEARKATQRAISSGSPRRPTGICGMMRSSSTFWSIALTMSVPI